MNNKFIRNSRHIMVNAAGFTLIEVLVATVIFSIVMLVGLAFFSYGMKPVVCANEVTYALTIAENGIEDIRRACTSSGAFQVLGLFAELNADGTFTDPDRGVVFTRRTGIATYPGNMMKRVTVYVTWKPGNETSAEDKTIAITTMFVRPVW